jgi:hypothetical protein
VLAAFSTPAASTSHIKTAYMGGFYMEFQIPGSKFHVFLNFPVLDVSSAAHSFFGVLCG